jgi:secretion/DNA translocation related CpaE-like protein
MTAAARRPLLVTTDSGLIDAVLSVANVAQVEMAVAADLGAAAEMWTSAPLILVDAALLVPGVTVPARPGLIVVTRAIDEADAWRRLVNVGAEHIVELPLGAPWLYERFGRSLDSEPASDLIVVVGAAGGSGCSSLAAALARHHNETSGAGVLVDLDPSGGGIDLMLGAETSQGARWDELAGIGGRVDDRVLLQALPRAGGLPVLSWPPASEVEPDAVAVGHVLDALSRSRAAVVVDAGRGVDMRSTIAFTRAARAVVVVPLRVRAVSAARRVLHRLPHHVEPLVVAREPAPGGLRPEDLASALGVPVSATLADDRRRGPREELGGPAPGGALWRRVCEALLESDRLAA